MMESLDSRTAKEFLARTSRVAVRGVGHVGAFAYAVPWGIFLWFFRDDLRYYPHLKPSLIEEIGNIYHNLKPKPILYYPRETQPDNIYKNSSMGNPTSHRVLKFPKPPQ